MKIWDELHHYVRYMSERRLWQAGLGACIVGLWKTYGKSKIPTVYKTSFESQVAFVSRRIGKALLPPLDPFDTRGFPSSLDQIGIKLVTRTFSLQDFPAWDFKTDELEDGYALHRFEWLLPLLVSTGSFHLASPIKTIVSSWIDQCSQNHERPGWDSYSISERCINWLYFLSLLDASTTDVCSFTEKVKKSLEEQIRVLKSQLEFRGAATNNHVINNARALYLTGLYLQDAEATRLGKIVATISGDAMFSPSGFLKEGSSHYHILLCRTYLELYWAAQHAGDDEFLEVLVPLVQRFLKASFFFMTEESLPLIGDVSPDYVTSFHAKYVSPEKTESNWYSLYELQLKEFELMKGPCKGLVSYADAGYYRFKNDSYTVFIYVNPLNHIPAGSHAHADIGGFVMYWKDKPFLVDTGRYHYRDDSMGRYGRSVRSHNSISIDEKEPVVVHGLNGYPQLIHADYFQSAPVVRIENETSMCQLQIEYHGFSRYFRGTKIIRTFSFFETCLRIEDWISGEGCHQVESFFHFSPDVSVQSESQEIHCTLDRQSLQIRVESKNGIALIACRGMADSSPAGWHCPEYGQALPTWTVINHQKKTFPIHNCYDIGQDICATNLMRRGRSTT